MVIHKATLTFEYADEILRCDHSNESAPVLSHGAIFKKIYKMKFGNHVEICLWLAFFWIPLSPPLTTGAY